MMKNTLLPAFLKYQRICTLLCFLPCAALALDSDNDGLSDAEEIIYGTDPLITDSDSDSIADGWEVIIGEDPTVKRYELSIDIWSDKPHSQGGDIFFSLEAGTVNAKLCVVDETGPNCLRLSDYSLFNHRNNDDPPRDSGMQLINEPFNLPDQYFAGGELQSRIEFSCSGNSILECNLFQNWEQDRSYCYDFMINVCFNETNNISVTNAQTETLNISNSIQFSYGVNDFTLCTLTLNAEQSLVQCYKTYVNINENLVDFPTTAIVTSWGFNEPFEPPLGELIFDADKDNIRNEYDTDDDNDGVPDTIDHDDFNPFFVGDIDIDGDQLLNSVDPDDDGDGYIDTIDGFPFDITRWADADGDLIEDSVDNCISVSNYLQEDVDNDQVGDACDVADHDGDGHSDQEEVFLGSDPHNAEIQPYWRRSYYGEDYEDFFGDDVSDAGDVNGDGYPDSIIGVSRDDTNGEDSGSALVLSGINGEVLYNFYGDNALDYFGGSVSSAGDVNNDGYDDVVVGTNKGYQYPSGDYVKVYSGRDGIELYSFNGSGGNSYTFGYSVSDAGDVNNDGYDDIIIGEPLADTTGMNSGQAKVFSGKDGSILYSFDGDGWDYHLGIDVSDAGDVNNDGYADVVVGSNGAYLDGGSAKVFSGANGAILYEFLGGTAKTFGVSVSGAGDMNGDGHTDVIVGAPAYCSASFPIQCNGFARVFSGANGAVLYDFSLDTPPGEFGRSVSDVGDVNNDGYDDVAIGSFGEAHVYSGIDGMSLFRIGRAAKWASFGEAVSGAGDIDMDGYADLIIGGRRLDHWNQINTGSVRIILIADLLNDIDTDFYHNAIDFDPNNVDEWVDTDLDGIGNSIDEDDDNDGTIDAEDAFPLDATETADSDADGIGDNADTDDDNDGEPDVSDAFPLDITESQDSDGDGMGNNADACDATVSLDNDNDGDGCDDLTEDNDDDNDLTPDIIDADPLDPNINDVWPLDGDYRGQRLLNNN